MIGGPQNRLLVVDDDPMVGDAIKHVAEGIGFDVAVAGTPQDFYDTYSSFRPTVVILDLMMPDTDGIELMRFLAESRCLAQILLASGVDINIIHSAQRLGRIHGLNMAGVLQKPMSVADLESVLRLTMDDGPALTPAALRDAIDLGQVVNYYQPRVTLTPGGDRVTEGVEAFVRWEHPHYGVVPPDNFILLAEQSQLIVPMTLKVIQNAIAQAKIWQNAGLNLSIAVKLPGDLLTHRELPDMLTGYLDGAGVDRRTIVLELRENEAMANTARTMEVLTRLRLKNLRLAIDNFGTGFTSLVELCRMPFNELNIDKSLSGATSQQEEVRRAVKSIVSMAHTLELDVCMKGIEDQEAFDFARSLGCAMAQGYYICAPVAPDAVDGAVRQREAVA
jgi:EAL domain-containing protein (putative c-di-GMP-specific phosphodiesterase class I)/ActR/RegA family two-component response regulator